MTMNESQKKIVGYSAIAMCVLTIISCIVWFFSVPAYADSFDELLDAKGLSGYKPQGEQRDALKAKIDKELKNEEEE